MSILETLPPDTLLDSRVRGTIVHAHTSWVLEYYGDPVMTRVLNLLPSHAAADVIGAAGSSWSPLESLILLDSAIADVCGRSERQSVRDLGRFTAHALLGAMSESFRREGLHAFFHAGGLRDCYLHAGEWQWQEVSATHGVLTIAGMRNRNSVFCAGVSGLHEQTVLMHGGNAPAVVESSCTCAGDDACVFDISWR